MTRTRKSKRKQKPEKCLARLLGRFSCSNTRIWLYAARMVKGEFTKIPLCRKHWMKVSASDVEWTSETDVKDLKGLEIYL